MKGKLLAGLLLVLCAVAARGQSFYNIEHVTIPAPGYDVYDTIHVASLPSATLNSLFGLDSVSFNATFPYEYDLVISLVAPDGTIVHLSDYHGNGPDFTGTCFTMQVGNFVNDAYSPMNGTMQPDQWLGRINNGHPGTGNWLLHVENHGYGSDTGTILSWGVTFDNTPAPPQFFSSSTLPIVVVNTNDVAINAYAGTDVPGTMGIINNGAGSVNHITDAFNDYNGYLTMKVRGSSSRSFPTPSYSITTTDSVGNQVDSSLLGIPADHSWILYAPWDDKALIRDVITYKMSNDMGEYATRTRMVELYMNNDYRGVYVLEEHISRGAQRVNVHKMNTTDISGSAVTGGYIWQVDRGTPGYDAWVSSMPPCDSATSSIIFAYVYPKVSSIADEQRAYIAAYTDSFENALKNLDLYDTVNGYRKYIDVPSFIDQCIMQEVGHNVDGYRLSSYLHKDRNGKIQGGPIWDFNLAFGNADYYDGAGTDSWEWDFPCPFYDGSLHPFWWKQFLTDTNYMQELKCRYTTFRASALDTVHMDHVIDSLVTMLDVPQQRHYRRWPILGVYEWPNAFVGSTYDEEVNYLKTWIQARIAWMDLALLDSSCTPPVLPLTSLITEKEHINIYPSPTDNELNITGNVLFTHVSIYNMMGQKVYGSDAPVMKLHLRLGDSDLSPGIYNVVVETPSAITRKKVVLTR